MLNQEKTGKYIAEKRKQMGMTQKQLAEQVGITDKAVSKWERGKSIPDSMVMEELCRTLQITMNEFFSGEDIQEEYYSDRAEENIRDLMEESSEQKKSSKIVVICLAAGFAAIFQNYHLIPELTCEENIRMPLCFSKKSKTNEKKLDQWIQGVGLAQKKKLFPNQMSGGEQQRTAILRAIVNNPQMLFADEPTGALDSKTGDSIIKFLLQYAHNANKTILLVTHDKDIAAQCDRVIEMADGRIVSA